MYIYESHLGTLYWSDEFLSLEYLYCEKCGDYDNYIGFASNKEEVLDMIDLELWNKEYVLEFVESIQFE